MTPLTFSRKELNRLGHFPEEQADLTRALVSTSDSYGSEQFESIAKPNISLCGVVATAGMAEAEITQPEMCLPVFLSVDGVSDTPGLMIPFADSILMAWTEGTFRMKYCVEHILNAEIGGAEADAKRIPPELSFHTDRDWRVTFHVHAFNSGESLIDRLLGALESRH